MDDVELGTLGWVDWWNNRRLHSALEYLPPAEFEALYGALSPDLDQGGMTTAEKTDAQEPLLELSGSN